MAEFLTFTNHVPVNVVLKLHSEVIYILAYFILALMVAFVAETMNCYVCASIRDTRDFYEWEKKQGYR